MRTLLCAMAVTATLAFSSASALATPAQGEAEYARGVALYKEGRYADAAAAFAAAHEADRLPKYLYNLAQAERLAGDCHKASVHYRAFIDTAPPEDQRRRAADNLASCEEILATAPKPEPAPPIASSVAPPVSTAPASPLVPSTAGDPSKDQRPIEDASPMSDVAGGVLLGSGLAVIAAGAAVLGYSYVAESNASDPQGQEPTYQEHRAELERAGALRLAGAIGMGAGGALCVGALARYLVVSSSSVTPTVAVTPDGAFMSVTGKF
jgi:tetratricopeptide (TPR) repeat protein